MRIWTEEDRKRQSEMMRRTKPWLKSTGPRTPEGKKNLFHEWLENRLPLAGREAVTQSPAPGSANFSTAAMPPTAPGSAREQQNFAPNGP